MSVTWLRDFKNKTVVYLRGNALFGAHARWLLLLLVVPHRRPAASHERLSRLPQLEGARDKEGEENARALHNEQQSD